MAKVKDIEGQVTLWNMEVVEKPTTPKIEQNIMQPKKEPVEVKNYSSNIEKAIAKYKELENVNRIIKYCSGGLGVEIKEEDSYKTIWVNREGKEEAVFQGKTSVLPMDRIIYYTEELKANELQEERLRELKVSKSDLEEIRRKGDENIIAIANNRIYSINSKGWILEYENIKAIYTEDEVIKEHEEESLENMQESIKENDLVEAYHGKRKIKGRICRVYGQGEKILNIIFDNETKHTAIGRMSIIRRLNEEEYMCC